MKINKENFYTILFFISVFVPTLNYYEVTLVIWSFLFLITLKEKYAQKFLLFTIPFFIILLVAFIVSFFYDYKLYNLIRDFAYLTKPIVGFYVGYNLFLNTNNKNYNPFDKIVIVGLLIAIYHLLLVVFVFTFLGEHNVRVIRGVAGFFNDFEVYTLVILLFHKKFQLSYSTKKIRIYIFILALSSFFYLARTNFIQFVILLIALKGWFVLTQKTVIIISSVVFSTLMFYAGVFYYNPRRNGDGIDEFLYKIKEIPTEAFSTKIDRNDWKDFNDHFRSYENIRTIQQLSNNKTFLVGEGLGSSVDLKQKVLLGDKQMRFIPKLHNGFMTILLKSGLLGIFFLLISIFYFIKKPSKSDLQIEKIDLLLLGTGFFLFVSYWVFLGFYNLLDTKVVLIGFLLSYKFSLERKNSLKTSS